jgi:hypothetical protein
VSDLERFERKMLAQDAAIDAREDDERNSECGATWVSRGLDPYGTECDLKKGHYPGSDHRGLNPYGVGFLTWRGGGSCAGDALPYEKVQFHYPEPESGVNHPLHG